jgi:hypothetical protein
MTEQSAEIAAGAVVFLKRNDAGWEAAEVMLKRLFDTECMLSLICLGVVGSKK